MMKSEFVERTGFEPTAAEYAEIEAEYMGTDVDKDRFCKEWKKSGGIQRLMRLRARRIEELESEPAKEKADYDRMDAQYCRRINEIHQACKSETDNLKQKVAVLRQTEADAVGKMRMETARADEAEKRLAVLRDVFAIITGNEEV